MSTLLEKFLLISKGLFLDFISNQYEIFRNVPCEIQELPSKNSENFLKKIQSEKQRVTSSGFEPGIIRTIAKLAYLYKLWDLILVGQKDNIGAESGSRDRFGRCCWP